MNSRAVDRCEICLCRDHHGAAVLPAVFFNEPVELPREGLDVIAARALYDSGVQFFEHGEIGQAGDDEGAVVIALHGIGRDARWLQPLLRQEVDLLAEFLEGEIRFREGRGVVAIGKSGLAALQAGQLQNRISFELLAVYRSNILFPLKRASLSEDRNGTGTGPFRDGSVSGPGHGRPRAGVADPSGARPTQSSGLSHARWALLR